LSLLLLLLVLAGCAQASAGGPAATDSAPAQAQTQAQTQAQSQTPPQTPEAPVRARILGIGDLLPHVPLVTGAATADGGYDFKPLFAPVRPWIEGADLTIGDFETNFAGTEYPWSGYPSFNTPDEFARDLKAVGFDAVAHANNHSLDYDEPGLERTISVLDQYGLPHTGTFRSPAEREQIPVLNAGPSIKVALLAYTYATNGVPLPYPWSVNLLDPDRIRSDVHRARQLPGVDLVAVALHFGETEYIREPDASEEQYVALTLQAGADIILGDHVHVLQKIETRQVTDDFGRTGKRAVAFCMGNFVHNQVGFFQEEGLMMVVDVKKEKGQTTVEQVSFIPTWVHKYMDGGVKRFRAVAVEKALHDYETQADPLLTAEDYAKLKATWAGVTQHVVGTPDVAVFHADQPFAPGGTQ
jgi:poly-gamma-glutamate synthesis protein (capsule biosynthesis protein)